MTTATRKHHSPRSRGLELSIRHIYFMATTFLIAQDCGILSSRTSAFQVSLPLHSRRHERLFVLRQAAGRGMGMAQKPRRKKGAKKKKTPVAAFDVNASLMRLEKRYDELLLESAKAMKRDDDPLLDDDKDVVVSEYVIAVRSSKSSERQSGALSDWVPVAQLCLARAEEDAVECDGASGNTVQAAISCFCRELSQVATLGSPIFKSVARNELQYSVESLESFHKFVYESIVEPSQDDSMVTMTKSEARKVLKLHSDPSEIDRSEIKNSYRRLSFDLHPDRPGDRTTPEEIHAAAVEYTRVKRAYETLTSGIRGSGSWYESLGGKSRTDFVGPVALVPISDAKELLERDKVESAIIGLDPELVQTFIARHQSAK